MYPAARAARRLVVVLAAIVLLGAGPSPAAAAETDAEPVLTEAEAVALVLDEPEVAGWLDRYPEQSLVTTAHYEPVSRRWDVSVLTPTSGKIVAARVDDRTGATSDVWIGPQVAWPLARGGGVGGSINEPVLWLTFCLLFLLGLADFRRPLSLPNLDLVALLSFSAHVAFLNEGRAFASALAAAASLVYLIVRAAWVGVTDRPATLRPTVPVWLLVAGLVFLLGLRVGLNTNQSSVLDVGYAGVIGADRLASGESPYGNFPGETGVPCGAPNAEGNIVDWVQEDGRCETANPLGDTYGPVNYHAYLPGLWLFGWSGHWDALPAVHFTTIVFDLLAMAGLAAIGYRRGGGRLAVVLAFAWAANPLTQYTSSSNANDSIMAALLVWGFWAATSPPGRGVLLALACWTKFAALILVPLWATYPARRGRRAPLVFAGAFAATTLLSFWVLLVGGDPVRDARVFLERTFLIQFDRTSPFSLWDWGRYGAAGLPDLAWLQRVLQVVLVGAALLVAALPRRKSPLQLAAFSAALVMAFQLLLTHWSALYVVWFLPFLLLVVLAGDVLRGGPDTDGAEVRRSDREPDPATEAEQTP